jgi:cell division protein FtsB
VTATIIAIIAVVISAVPLYYLARSNARETARQRAEATGKAVAAVAAPLQAEIAELKQTVRDRDRRIERLEDQLRRLPE